jgi:hypothetical protein
MALRASDAEPHHEPATQARIAAALGAALLFGLSTLLAKLLLGSIEPHMLAALIAVLSYRGAHG